MDKIIHWIGDNALIVTGAVFAFLISILSRRERSWLDRLTSAVLCSLLSTGIFYGINVVLPNCPQEAAVAIGSFVGFYGVSETKRLILQRIKSIISPVKKDKNDE